MVSYKKILENYSKKGYININQYLLLGEKKFIKKYKSKTNKLDIIKNKINMIDKCFTLYGQTKNKKNGSLERY